MTDRDVLVTEDVPAPKEPRSRRIVARRAAESAPVPSLPTVSLTALVAGDEVAVKTVTGALEAAGFFDNFPDGDTFPKAYARLQRYLGYGHRPTGVPDSGSLSWLALRTQTFTTTE